MTSPQGGFFKVNISITNMKRSKFKLDRLTLLVVLVVLSSLQSRLLSQKKIYTESDYFILGSKSTPANFELTKDTLLFWNNEKGAIRAGGLNNSEVWAPNLIGQFSSAFGLDGLSAGFATFSAGIGLSAKSYSSAVFGRYNVGFGTIGSWVPDEFLVEVGNGSSNEKRSNALSLLKNGSLFVGHYYYLTPNTVLDTTLMFFDRRKGAFRVGKIGQTNVWAGTNVGQYSFSAGFNTLASGEQSVALGQQSRATGDNSFSAGNASEASGQSSFAVGFGSKSLGNSSATIGYGNEAHKFGTIAIGFENKALESYDMALGFQNVASGGTSTTLGAINIASGAVSTAMGIGTKAQGNYSTSLGFYTTAKAYGSVALGRYNLGIGNSFKWEGTDPVLEVGIGSASIPANALTVLKNGEIHLKNYRFPVQDGEAGEVLSSDGAGNLSWKSSGLFLSQNFGLDGDIIQTEENYENHSFMLGSNNSPSFSGRDTFLLFDKERASLRVGTVDQGNWKRSNIGFGSIAFGKDSWAQASYSVAIGNSCRSFGVGAVALGNETEVKGNGSFAAGNETSADGEGSVAFGSFGSVQGKNSLKAGFNNNITGDRSTVFGSGNNVTGTVAFSAGLTNSVSGNYSFAMGESLIADYQNSFVIGKYNEQKSNPTLFEIGAGNITKRNNVFTVFQGATNAYPGITVGNARALALFNIKSYIPEIKAFEVFDLNDNTALGVTAEGDMEVGFDMSVGGQIIFSQASKNYKLTLPNIATLADGTGIAYAWHTYSDQRVKSNVKPTNYGLKSILTLNPVQYDHHSSEFIDGSIIIKDDSHEDLGFLAQEVYEVIPEIVVKPEDEESQLWSLNYEKLTPVLVKAIQEQQEEIEELKEMLALLLKQQNELVSKFADQNSLLSEESK